MQSIMITLLLQHKDSTLELLKDAKERIVPREHWTQNSFAKDEKGDIISFDHPKAVKWCALGTLEKSVSLYPRLYEFDDIGDPFTTLVDLLEDIAEERFIDHTVSMINDNMGHDSALQLYDYAISFMNEAKNEREVDED